MTPTHITAFCQQHGLAAEVVTLPEHGATVEAAAQALGVSVESICKSVLFLVDAQPVLVIANGTRRIDYKRVADHFGVNRKRTKLADAATVLAVTGFAVGTVPPFGHTQPLRTVVDRGVLAQPIIYAGGGALDALVRTTPAEVIRATQAETVDVIQA